VGFAQSAALRSRVTGGVLQFGAQSMFLNNTMCIYALFFYILMLFEFAGSPHFGPKSVFEQHSITFGVESLFLNNTPTLLVAF
jgi:hypothetical protein